MAHAHHADEALVADRRHRLGVGIPGLGSGNERESGIEGGARPRGDRVADVDRRRCLAHAHDQRQRGLPGAPLQSGLVLESVRQPVEPNHGHARFG
jgi:hypothetical protein